MVDWDSKWLWSLYVILSLVSGVLLHGYFEVSLAEGLIRAVPLSVGIVFAYYVRSKGSIRLYRISAIGGGAVIGFIVGAGLLVFLNLDFSPFGNLTLLWVMIVLFAIIVDNLMGRRNYRPFM